MLTIINEQLKNPKVLCKQRYYLSLSPQRATQVAADMYPIWQDYYHELNPGFLFRIGKTDYLNFFPMLTVRDGAVSFASFILKNPPSAKKIKTQFIIHPEMARFLPPQLKTQYFAWNVYQKKQIQISEAKKILLTGFANAQSLPSEAALRAKLSLVSKAPADCPIEIFMPIRNDPFSERWLENQTPMKIMEMIKGAIGNRNLRLLVTREMMERSNWNETYCLDLMDNNFVVSDSYLNHFIASRGGTTSAFSSQSNPEAFFEFDLSLNHKLQIGPLPDVESIYTEMIFYQKRSTVSDYIMDPSFHDLVRKKETSAFAIS